MTDIRKSTAALLLSLLLFNGIVVGFIYANSVVDETSNTESDLAMNFEPQKLQNSLASPVPSPVYIPQPSPLLLFGMGFLGVICVIINEKKKKSHTQKKPHNSSCSKAS